MNWSTIKNFGKIRYFNISYAIIIIVPMLANILQHYNESAGEHLQLPSTVKSLYIASLIYAIAIAIYQYACPSIIKDYENLQSYIDKNLEIFKNKAPDLKFYIVLANLKTTQEQTKQEIILLNGKISSATSEADKIKIKIDLDEKLNTVYAGTVQNYLETVYNTANSKNSLSIWASGVLYIAGSLIILILLIIRTILVLNN
jgi:hypothetical protein